MSSTTKSTVYALKGDVVLKYPFISALSFQTEEEEEEHQETCMLEHIYVKFFHLNEGEKVHRADTQLLTTAMHILGELSDQDRHYYLMRGIGTHQTRTLSFFHQDKTATMCVMTVDGEQCLCLLVEPIRTASSDISAFLLRHEVCVDGRAVHMERNLRAFQ